jgi:hypothetical protein
MQALEAASCRIWRLMVRVLDVLQKAILRNTLGGDSMKIANAMRLCQGVAVVWVYVVVVARQGTRSDDKVVPKPQRRSNQPWEPGEPEKFGPLRGQSILAARSDSYKASAWTST